MTVINHDAIVRVAAVSYSYAKNRSELPLFDDEDFRSFDADYVQIEADTWLELKGSKPRTITLTNTFQHTADCDINDVIRFLYEECCNLTTAKDFGFTVFLKYNH